MGEDNLRSPKSDKDLRLNRMDVADIKFESEVARIESYYRKDVEKVESLYEQLRGTKEELEKISSIPKDTRLYLERRFEKAAKYRDEAIKDLRGYKKNAEKLMAYKRDKFNFEHSDPTTQSMKSEGYQRKLDYEIGETLKLVMDYNEGAENFRRGLRFVLGQFKEAADAYKKRGESHGTHAEKLVAFGITGIFGATLLYAISQVNPENVTVGAFSTGAASPTLAIIFTAVVVFLAFFLVHHKLK